LVKSVGVDNAEIVSVKQIVCDPVFRQQCASNACGMYGKCWMCPPDVGEITQLIEQVYKYQKAVLYQSIFKLEDSFDFEGMQAGGYRHFERSRTIDALLREAGFKDFLHLGKGGCGVCTTCAKVEGKPCRFPEKALPSLEAYGVNVSATVKHTSMKYINGTNTVTYFGMILFKENDTCPG